MNIVIVTVIVIVVLYKYMLTDYLTPYCSNRYYQCQLRIRIHIYALEIALARSALAVDVWLKSSSRL